MSVHQNVQLDEDFVIIRNMIKYFWKYGVNADVLKSKDINVLYRGLNETYHVETLIIDRSFVSTTYDKAISKKFAGTLGSILKLKVSELPKYIPFVIIDETIGDFFLESEVLFLPGIFTVEITQRHKTYLTTSYSMNKELVKRYNKMKNNPVITHDDGAQVGGYLKKFGLYDSKHAGKTCIIWRAIHDKPVDILQTIKLPDKPEDVIKYMHTKVRPISDYYWQATQIIPDFKELGERMKHHPQRNSDGFWDIAKKHESYMIHTAVVNTEKLVVDTIHMDSLTGLFEEMFDMRRVEEVKNALVQYVNTNIIGKPRYDMH